MLVWILSFSTLGSVGTVLAASLFLWFPEKIRVSVVPNLIAYAVGTLLGAAFLGLLPHALEDEDAGVIMPVVLAGILLFFFLEKALLWRHCHVEECEVHHAAAPLILLGDGLHNFVDGVVIAAAFLGGIPLGVTTALAVIVHEVPQEVGDFAILLQGGFSPRRALAWNVLSSTATIPGALLGYVALGSVEGAVPLILAISAASFIYIAAADLIPSLHRGPFRGKAVTQTALVLAGVATIALLRHS